MRPSGKATDRPAQHGSRTLENTGTGEGSPGHREQARHGPRTRVCRAFSRHEGSLLSQRKEQRPAHSNGECQALHEGHHLHPAEPRPGTPCGYWQPDCGWAGGAALVVRVSLRVVLMGLLVDGVRPRQLLKVYPGLPSNLRHRCWLGAHGWCPGQSPQASSTALQRGLGTEAQAQAQAQAAASLRHREAGVL